MRRTSSVCLFLGLLATAGPASAAEMLVLQLDPERTSVDFLLDATMHTVHGHLGSASGRIAFDPASALATGELVIDLADAETGVSRRDRKMHEKILETDRYPTAVFRVNRLDLPQSLQQGRNELQLHGELELRGARHAVAVPAVAILDGDRITATAWLEIPYIDWGLEDPSFFVLRVAKTVRVEIETAGRLEGELPASAAAERRR